MLSKKLKFEFHIYKNKMEKTILFTDDMYSTKTQCETKIKVQEKTYDSGKQVYVIDYIHTYIDDGKQTTCCLEEDVKFPNPFAFKHLQAHFDGEIIIKNEMTDIMVKFLMMDNKDLEKHIGREKPEHYKMKIMHNINNLWD